MPGGLALAILHLTVLPAPLSPGDAEPQTSRALPWFPVAGLLVGAAPAAVLLLPLPALPRAALALAAWVAITGGLHEDGLMDCADAALAPVTRERRLEILRDPHAGAHAVTAAGVVLLLRFAALTAVPPAAPIAAAVLGRWSMVVTLSRFPPVRAEGLGRAFSRHARALPATLVAAALLVGVAWIGTASRPALAALAAGGTAIGVAATLARRFGGVTGDVHGAAGLLAETAALYAFLGLAS